MKRTRRRLQPLKLLSRTDKWYVGGASRLIWTPLFPKWLLFPGYWDEAHYYNCEISPVFTWTLLDEHGKEIPLTWTGRVWNPAGLVTRFSELSGELKIRETKCAPSEGLLSSLVALRNTGRRRRTLHLVLWTAQQSSLHGTTLLEALDYAEGEGMRFRKYLQRKAAAPLSCECRLGVGGRVRSWGVQLSEGSALEPHWNMTPFAESFSRCKLPSEMKLSGVTQEGLVFMGLHTTVNLSPGGPMREVPLYFSAAPSTLAERRELPGEPQATRKTHTWQEYYRGVPYFECSDEYLTRYYWYRWYGLRLLTLPAGDEHYRQDVVCEGIGYFRAPISYSAPCHMLENRWMHDPRLARGSLLTFIDNQRPDGGFRGYIDPDYYRQEMFYHANWGLALRELDALHPDAGFLEAAYAGLARYAEYFDRERSPEGDSLYDITNHYETGQEYMHRYMAASPDADRENWGEVFRLKGVDVTVYMYELKRALALAAQRLSKPREEQARWKEGAERIRDAVLAGMWDPEEEMFFDILPSRGARSRVKAAVCFYPYMTDIVGRKQLHGLRRHLLSRREFWTPYPAPSSSTDDEFFSAEPLWKGKRMNCPWNGRVWPMTNSHIAEAMAQTGIRFKDPLLRRKAAEFMHRFVRMMFFEADPTRPNCFEHYNPLSGAPSIYRGVDDYQHSWVNDLIIKYAVGLRVSGEGGVVVDPLPFGLSFCVLEDAPVRGHRVSIERKRDVVLLSVDGKVRHRGPLPHGGLTFTLP